MLRVHVRGVDAVDAAYSAALTGLLEVACGMVGRAGMASTAVGSPTCGAPRAVFGEDVAARESYLAELE